MGQVGTYSLLGDVVVVDGSLVTSNDVTGCYGETMRFGGELSITSNLIKNSLLLTLGNSLFWPSNSDIFNLDLDLLGLCGFESVRIC